MSNNTEFEKIPQEKFRLVQMDERIHDKKLETKARGYFADAMLRFSKNKSSVVAAWILLFLLVFSVISPIISPYDIKDKDKLYVNCPSFVKPIADLGWGIMDGGRVIADDTPRNIGKLLYQQENDLFSAMPTPVRVFYGAGGEGDCPLTVREGRNWLSKAFIEVPRIAEFSAKPMEIPQVS